MEIVDYRPDHRQLRLILLQGLPFSAPGSLTVQRADGGELSMHQEERRMTLDGVEPGAVLRFVYQTGRIRRGEGLVRFERALPPPEAVDVLYGFPPGD